MGETFLWWLALEMIGLAGLPLTMLVFANLPDRGWTLARPFSLLILGWLIWFPLSIVSALPFNRVWIIGTLLVYIAGNLALALRVRRVRAALTTVLTRHRGYIVFAEVLFAGAFAGMVWERSFTPAVVDTEKFMDVAFLSSIWRAPHLPPPDPWLSGQTINYYYFGHYLVALVAKLLGTVPAVAFNLGVGMVFALAAIAIFGVAANLIGAIAPNRRWRWRGLVGVTSAVFVLVLGNLNGAQIWWQNARALAQQFPTLYSSPWAWWLHRDLWTQYDWWSPSRVIPNTINEFPAFSFALADLHAHVLALPFAAVAIGLAGNLVLARGMGIRAFGEGHLSRLALLASGVAIGGLYAINGWDLPTYLGLALLALAIQQWLAHERAFSRTLVIDFLTAAAILGALCFLCYLPFYRDYSSPGEGIGLVPANARTPVGYEVAIFGLSLFFIGSLALLRLLRRWPAPGAQVSLACAVVLALGSWLTPTVPLWTLLWAVLLIAVLAYLAADVLGLRLAVRAFPVATGDDACVSNPARAGAWLWCLAGTAIALIAACELVYLRDVFAFGGNGALGIDFRMNTVFKLYYQAWLLLGIVAGPALFLVASALVRRLRVLVTELMRGERPAVPALATAGGTSLQAGGAEAAIAIVSPLAAVMPPSGSTSGSEASGTLGRVAPSSSGAGSGLRRLRLLTVSGIVLWIAVAIALVGAAAIYPVLAVSVRTNSLTLARSLDGAAYMDTDAVDQGDAQAIAWLNAHVVGNPVIVEGARYDEYTHYGRVSAFTGLPTLLGWGGHEVQWRYNWLQQPGNSAIIDQRLDAVTRIYTVDNQQQVLALLHRYSVKYVYVGAAEHQLFPSANLGRFASYLRVVYHSANVTIYEVP
jgi:YYY domain-containing protein